MDGIKLIKEPECWCGPNSVAAEPRPFRDIPEDHFQLTAKETGELQTLWESKAKEDEFGHPPPAEFVLKGGPADFQTKQRQLSAALDEHTAKMKRNPEESRPIIDELLKLNNVSLCDSDYEV